MVLHPSLNFLKDTKSLRWFSPYRQLHALFPGHHKPFNVQTLHIPRTDEGDRWNDTLALEGTTNFLGFLAVEIDNRIGFLRTATLIRVFVAHVFDDVVQ